MNFLGYKNVWQAQNLPDGIAFKNGIFSGTPTKKGNFIVPVTVSNDLGSSTKNISIFVRSKPGTEKFSILQNGEEIEQVTIPQLQKMVQDGTAQEKYNCTNTQLVMPFYVPDLSLLVNFNTNEYYEHKASVETVTLNFCSFRNVTLQDGTVKPGLILQFDKMLWPIAPTFADWGGNNTYGSTNRWKYSRVRQWLNSLEKNWATPLYDGQTISDSFKKLYSDIYPGFLNFLPQDFLDVLTPIKVTTQAYFEDQAEFDAPDEELDDGIEVDITYDKIFIPSLEEMNIQGLETASNTPKQGVEGTAWEYYVNKFKGDYQLSIGSTNKVSYWQDDNIFKEFEKNIAQDFVSEEDRTAFNTWDNGRIMLRSAASTPDIPSYGSGLYYDNFIIFFSHGQNQDGNLVSSAGVTTGNSDDSEYCGQPAPAFVIC